MHRLASTFAVALAAVTVAGDGGDRSPSRPVVVVPISVQRCARPQTFHGVGVLVGGRVVTAAHLVEGQLRRLEVDGRPAVVTTIDARLDLAVVDADGVGDSATARRSPGAVAIVTPEGSMAADVLDTGPLVVHDASAGVVHRREAHLVAPAVAPGTSGAPLVSPSGEILGIVVLSDARRDRTYAVTSSEVARLLGASPQRRAGEGITIGGRCDSVG